MSGSIRSVWIGRSTRSTRPIEDIFDGLMRYTHDEISAIISIASHGAFPFSKRARSARVILNASCIKVSTVKKSVKNNSPILRTVCSVALGGTVLLRNANTKNVIRQAKSTVLSKYHVEVSTAA
jgi:hypothetical protein